MRKFVILILGLNLALVSSNIDCNPVLCPQSDGPKLTLLPVPWDCKQYIMCQWGIAHYRPCGFGLYYDHTRTVCMPPYMTDCNICDLHGKDSENTDNTSVTPKNPIGEIKVDDDYESKENLENNTDDSDHDQSNEKTKSDENHGNLKTTLTFTTSNNPTEDKQINKTDENTIDNSQTDTTIDNHNNTQTTQSTTDNHNNTQTTTTDNHNNTQTTEPTTDNHNTTQTTPNPTASTTSNPINTGNISQKCISNSSTPVKCQQNMTDDRLMPHPDNCELFYYCVDFLTPICRECPANLHFNPSKKVCDFPETAGCMTPSELINAKSTHECDYDPNQKPGTQADLRPNVEDCTSYYMCVWGYLVSMSCPENQHFNPSLKVCDLPENAGCTEATESTET